MRTFARAQRRPSVPHGASRRVYRTPARADPAVRAMLRAPPSAQHACADCEEEKKVQRAASASRHAAGDVSATVASGTASGGATLSAAARNQLEPRFGHDFGDVRVHTGPQAADSARELNAHAYTFGRDVVFGAGRYAPETDAGRRLLAHELTHVLQQSADVRRDPDAPAGKPAAQAGKKILKETVLVDQDVMILEFDDNTIERHKIVKWNVRDPLPGTYLYTHRGDWKPALDWTKGAGNDVWTTDPIFPRRAGDRYTIEIVAGAAGQEIRSYGEALSALAPEMKELLMRERGLPIKSKADEAAAYRILRKLHSHSITPEELLAYQHGQGEVRRAASWDELAQEADRFIADAESKRQQRGTEEIDYLAATGSLAGDKDVYEEAAKLGKTMLNMRGDFRGLAKLYRERGNERAAEALERADEWTRSFEKRAIALGHQLLLGLELHLRVDMSYIAASNTPAWQKLRWERMQASLGSVEKPARAAYGKAEDYALASLSKQIEAGFSQTRGLTYDFRGAQERRKAAQAEANRLSDLAEQQTQSANKAVAGALPRLRAAQLFPDFPYEKAVKATDAAELGHVIERFILGKRGAVRGAQNHLLTPEGIYKLDLLLAYAKKELGIEKGSGEDLLIAERAAGIEARESWVDDLLTLLSIALCFVPGAGLLGLAARLAQLGADTAMLVRSIEKYNEQDLAYKSGLSSVEASTAGVLLEAAGAFMPLIPGSAPRPLAGELRGAEEAAAAGAKGEGVFVRKEMTDGHAIEVADDGIRLCSPPPCPWIRKSYKQELADNPRLDEQLSNAEGMRRIDPDFARAEAEDVYNEVKRIRAEAAGDVEEELATRGAKPTPTSKVSQYEKELERLKRRKAGGDAVDKEIEEARRQLAEAIEKRMPEGTRVRIISTERTEPGIAQGRAGARDPKLPDPDFEYEIDLPDAARAEAGLPLRGTGRSATRGVFKPDDIRFFGRKGEDYLFVDHKEVGTIWKESYYAADKGRQKIAAMLERHLNIVEAMGPRCKGFAYTTNENALANLIADEIIRLGPRAKGRLFPPGYGP